MRTTCIITFVLAGALLVSKPVLGAAINSYHVGNSLTWDASPPKVKDMAIGQGIDHDVGYHIRCGASLLAIWLDANVSTTCQVTETWDVALPNNPWNHVTFQPHTGGGSNLGSDGSIITNMSNLTATHPDNNNTIYYVYAAYPEIERDENGTWIDSWTDNWTDQTITNTPSQGTERAELYFEYLINNIRADQTVLEVTRMIPMGHVIYEFEKLAKAGKFPDFNGAIDLYRDRTHLNNVGRFMAMNTFYATMFQDDPTGINNISPFQPNPLTSRDHDLNGTLATQLEALVWNVVRSNLYTELLMPGDFDGDLAVTAADVALFIRALTDRESVESLYPGLAIDRLGDVDGSGTFDLGDLSAFSALFGGPGSAGSQAVPEPSAWFLALLALAGVAGRRRAGA